MAGLTVLLLLGIAIGCVGGYRLWIHPLSKFPGPRLSAISPLSLTWHAFQGDRHLYLFSLHDKYGPVVRISPNTLSFATGSALKTIYSTTANVQKSRFYTAFPATPQAVNVHSTIDKKVHSRKRRVLGNAFSDRAIRAVGPAISKTINTALDVLTPTQSDGWSKPVNAADWTNWLTFDIMGKLAFGTSFNMLTKTDNRFAADLVSSAAHRHLICGTNLVLHTAHLDKLLFPGIADGRTRYMAYSRAQFNRRLESGNSAEDRDIFHHLLSAVDPDTGDKFSNTELWGESNVLIIAGSDTTSTALSASLHYILSTPRAYNRVVSEIRSAFPRSSTESPDSIPPSALAECTYLRACIDESMRLSPPVPGYLPRVVLSGGMVIDGHDIPAGTDVGVPHYVLHHTTTHFPRPFEFIPERWILGDSWPETSHSHAHGLQFDQTGSTDGKSPSTTTSASLTRAHTGFCPFSLGPRGCIGKGLAYVEMMTTLARLFWTYDVRTVSAEPSQPGSSAAWSDCSLATAPQTCPASPAAQSCPYAAATSTTPPLRLSKQSPGQYPLMDTFTSRKDGPIMQVRLAV